MKAVVNQDCIGCGMCADICPQVFEMTDDRSEVVGNADAHCEEVTEAAAACPVNAIELQ